MMSGMYSQDFKVKEVLSHNTTSKGSSNGDSKIVRNEDGSVIVGWRSSRKGLLYSSIFLQKVDADGQPEWEGDGTPVCPFPANQSNFRMAADGYGGVVVAWEDHRHGSDQPSVYVQRINVRGEPLWGIDGLRVCHTKGAQRNPRIVADKEFGFYIVWEDSRNNAMETDIYGQHLDLAGKAGWMSSGLPISTSPRFQQNISLTSDEQGDLFVVWEDFRNGLFWNLFAQRINRKGEFLWGAGGLDVFSGVEENQHQPHVVSDGFGGLLFVYQRYSEETRGTDIYRGRLNANGDLMFHFATCYSQDEQLNPRIVRKGSKALLVWEDRRYGNWDIYAQMIRLSDGILEWGINGIPIIKSPYPERSPEVIGSASISYQVFTWVREVNGKKQIFVQKCDNIGERLWEAEGKLVCTIGDQQTSPAIVPDEQGGIWCSWTDRREKEGSMVYLQRFDSKSRHRLGAGGMRMGADHDQVQASVKGLELLGTRSGQFFACWEDFRNGKQNPDIYLQKLDKNGEPLWRRGGIPVCIAQGGQSQPQLVEDGVGGVIVVWSDTRKGSDSDVYAQRVNSTGKMLWRYQGIKVCSAPSSQTQVQVVTDGSEGALLAWVDARTLASTGFDIYIQRIDHSGGALWGENGKVFVNLPGLQTSPVLETDGDGGAYLAWMDYRGDRSTIYVQHINQFGMDVWESGGRRLTSRNDNQRDPILGRNFQNDLVVVWQEGRYGDGFEKLFMQCMTPVGTKLWGSNGKMVCNYPGRQSYPRLEFGEYGSFVVAWLDERTRKVNGVRLIAQRYNFDGVPQWKPDGVSIGDEMEEFNPYELRIDSEGQSYLLWNQNSGDGIKQVKLQMLTPKGEKKWNFSGKTLQKSPQNQEQPSIIVKNNGGKVIKWVENGEGTFKTKIKAIPL